MAPVEYVLRFTHPGSFTPTEYQVGDDATIDNDIINADLFTGKITDWSQVGGKAGKIKGYTRNTSSGTYKTFQKLAMNKADYGKDTQKMAGNEQIAEAVAGDVNGIGYVGLAYIGRDGIAAATVDGVAPSPATQMSYALSRNLYYYTIGEPTGAAKKFIEWSLTSPKAADVINKVGFIAPKVMKK